MAVKKAKRKRSFLFSFAEMTVFFIASGLLIGAAFSIDKMVEASRMRAQISQISRFDEAVAGFHEKFGGLPGDLLAVTAEREGLVTGNGTPSHSDGDGKISPCNPGWQHHLGCETALFWAQLAATGFIPGDFNSDNSFANERLEDVSLTMAPYLPESPMREGVYVAVWNHDAQQPAPAPKLPFGNYYEISRITGIEDEAFTDNPHALMPKEAKAIDSKIDDGSPMTGRVLVNGNAKWPDDAWGSFSKPGPEACTASDKGYNTHNYFLATQQLCHLAIALNCCDKDK